jgi:hypothetical protein
VLEGILIYIGFFIGIYLLGKTISTISKLIHYYQYLNRLNRLGPEINSIDLFEAEEELTRLNAAASSTFSRIKEKYKVSLSEDSLSIEHFVKADEASQKAKRRNAMPSKRIFRKRY